MVDYKYSVSDVCNMYGERHITYLRNAIRNKKVPAIKIRGRWYIEEENLDIVKKFIMQKQKSPTSW